MSHYTPEEKKLLQVGRTYQNGKGKVRKLVALITDNRVSRVPKVIWQSVGDAKRRSEEWYQTRCKTMLEAVGAVVAYEDIEYCRDMEVLGWISWMAPRKKAKILTDPNQPISGWTLLFPAKAKKS